MSDNEIKKLQINMATFEEKLKNFDKKLDDYIIKQKGDTAELKKIINDFIESADRKYAPIWTARAITWFIILVVGAVIVSLLRILGLET